MAVPAALAARSIDLATLLAVVVFLAASLTGIASAGDGHSGGRRNHLAGEASPYLQMHVYNPVDWYPWGEEALARARTEDKPIFLSVGYSTCYWCHVMERRVFSNPEIAKLMNDSFVNIKVDREERPDIDAIYMQATHLLTGRGGWPNSVFMTPDGKPFFAGTYFPPEDSPGRPGFPKIVESLSARWKSERADMLARAERVAAAIRDGFEQRAIASRSFDSNQLLARSVASLAKRYDPQHGGFSKRTKFPSPYQLELLLAAHDRKLPGDALTMLRKTLDEMAYGGIYDHLAGGFHRYSTEPTWSVPHFEKMLYDNAQLVGLYARAYRATGDGLYRHVAEGIASYLAAEMTDPMGGFYSAQDAEVDAEEGASYVFTEAQIRDVLGPERAAEFLLVYELVPVHPGGPGALRMRLPVAAALPRTQAADPVALMAHFEADRAKLLAARNRRPQPLRDEKVLAAWNGLAIRGLVDAGVELERPDYIEQAARSANFVLTRLLDEGGYLHRSFVAGSVRENAVLDDYAFLADGLIALYSATGDARWLRGARLLADRMIEDYEGEAGMGFYLSRASAGEDGLFVRPRVLTDNVTPAGVTVAFRLLRDLTMLTGDDRYRDAAERTQTALGEMFERAPAMVGTAVRALATGPQLPAPPLEQKLGDAPRPKLELGALPTGRDFVSSEVRRDGASDLLVRLSISDGWHVNANPASLAFLIPTRVEAKDARTLIDVVYPPGSVYHPRFSLEPLAVYEGQVDIRVKPTAPLAAGAKLALVFQACDDSSCLPPETVQLAVP
jgi:uncharacterized protein YyaL (SSP411 family)